MSKSPVDFIEKLQKLLDKRTALQTDELMKEIAKSNRTYEEILQFVTDDSKDL